MKHLEEHLQVTFVTHEDEKPEKVKRMEELITRAIVQSVNLNRLPTVQEYESEKD